MVELVWNFLQEIDKDSTYIVVTTSGLQLSRLDVALSDEVTELTDQVVHQLLNADGCVGYSLFTSVMPFSIWTVSIWASEDSVNKFFRSGTHLAVMKDLTELLKARFRHARWTLEGHALPPDWDQIVGKLEQADSETD